MHDIVFFQFFKHFWFPLPVCFLLLKSLKIFTVRKILQLSADHHARGDRFASCENIVSRSQTSSLPPSPRVFDNSAKYLGTSLNDQLLRRPDLTNSLVGVLSRAYPLEQIALMADVEAMFHQVRVRPSDFDALRFLWWPNRKGDQMKGRRDPACPSYLLPCSVH